MMIQLVKVEEKLQRDVEKADYGRVHILRAGGYNSYVCVGMWIGNESQWFFASLAGDKGSVCMANTFQECLNSAVEYGTLWEFKDIQEMVCQLHKWLVPKEETGND